MNENETEKLHWNRRPSWAACLGLGLAILSAMSVLLVYEKAPREERQSQGPVCFTETNGDIVVTYAGLNWAAALVVSNALAEGRAVRFEAPGTFRDLNFGGRTNAAHYDLGPPPERPRNVYLREPPSGVIVFGTNGPTVLTVSSNWTVTIDVQALVEAELRRREAAK